MSQEDEIFWLGGAPGASDSPRLADDEAFVAAIRSCCEASGYRAGRFVSAQGPYGTWLIEVQRAGPPERIVWNGRDRCLVLQRKLPSGGWEDPRSASVAATDTDGFVAAVAALLAGEPGA